MSLLALLCNYKSAEIVPSYNRIAIEKKTVLNCYNVPDSGIRKA